MKKVCVLLSTYNGEKYLQEQLDSLYNQDGIELTILVRDDGSSDNTIKLLKENAAKHSNMKWYTGENLRPAKSFMDLINKSASQDADYYAFCDQDDRWDEDKLKCAVEMMDKYDNDVPNMYYSNLRIVDKNLNFYRLSYSSPADRKQNSKYSCILENMATGCTIVFNRKASELITANPPKDCSMHDCWVFMVCTFFGNVIFDMNAHIDYRQHEDNVVGTYLKKKSVGIAIRRFKRLFNRELQPRYNNAVNFYECFGNMLDGESKDKVLEIVNYKKSFSDKLKLINDKDLYGTSLSRNFRLKVLILLEIV